MITFPGSTFAKGDYARVIELCTGALKTGVNRSDHWGKVHLLRAQAHAGMKELPQSLEELEAAVEFWTSKYYFATDEDRAELAQFGTGLGRMYLDGRSTAEALRAFSAAGMGSGKPADYLERLAAELEPGQKSALWPEAPFLIVKSFANPQAKPLEKMVEEQGRNVSENRLDSEHSPGGSGSAVLAVSASTQAGRSWFGVPVYLPVFERPFLLRLYAKQQEASDLGVFLTYWFESSRKSASTVDLKADPIADGWMRFDIRRNFAQERLAEGDQQGYMATGGFINSLGLSLGAGPANRVWLDRIELLLSDTASS